jgi:putative transposase
VNFAQSIGSLWQAVNRRLRQWTKPINDTLLPSTVLDLTRSKPDLVGECSLAPTTHRAQTPDQVSETHLARPGAGRTAGEQAANVEECATWGAERIWGELLKLGLRVSKSAIQKYIEEVRKSHPSSQNWATFLRNHARQIWTCNFLQMYDIFFRTVFVLITIELGSRRVVHFRVTRNPTDWWIAQQLREATPFGERPRFLIRDNDRKYGTLFRRAAKGIEGLKTPYRAPKANAICEQFLGSLRRECLDHVLILSERHLHRIVKEYTEYFNHARPHQGIEQRIPCRPGQLEAAPVNGRLASRPVLAGLHHDYY